MLPGFSAELMPKGREKESQAKIKRYMTMMDSMTDEGNQLYELIFELQPQLESQLIYINGILLG